MNRTMMMLGILLTVFSFACKKKDSVPDPGTATRRVITGAFRESQGFHALCITHDGKIAICAVKGDSNQLYVALLDGGLKTLWEHTYSRKIDNAGGIIETAEGGFAVAVNRNITGMGLPWNYCPGLIRLDASGTLLWEKSYLFTASYWQDYPLLETRDGGLMMEVTHNGILADPNRFYPTFFKISATGDSLWAKSVPDEFNCYASDLVLTLDEDYRMTGPCGMVRSSTEGVVDWAIYPDMRGISLQAMGTGPVAVCGEAFGTTGSQARLAAIDAAGQTQWSKVLADGVWNLRVYGLCYTSDGGFACLMKKNDDIVLIRTDNQGTVLSERKMLSYNAPGLKPFGTKLCCYTTQVDSQHLYLNLVIELVN